MLEQHVRGGVGGLGCWGRCATSEAVQRGLLADVARRNGGIEPRFRATTLAEYLYFLEQEPLAIITLRR